MIRTRFAPAFVVCALFLAIGCATTQQPLSNAAQERAAFAGTWEFVSVDPAGITKEAKLLVFRDDGTYAAIDAAGSELWSGTFELDTEASPKHWDHRSYASAKTGGDVLGIYAIDNDVLTANCVAGKWENKTWIGKPRPETFERGAADVVLKLRRVQ